MKSWRGWAGLVVCLTLGASAAVHPQQAAQLRATIETIANGADSAGRARAITSSLEGAGIAYQTEAISFPNFSGTNIVVNVGGGGQQTLLLSAHYDRTPLGTGAVDNAASCAVLLELVGALRAAPLTHYSVSAVFFDLEERGLVGSQAYIARHRASGLPDALVNLDIFGYGDTLFANVFPPAGPLADAFQAAARQASVPTRVIEDRAQYPASDHRPFMSAGIQALGLALIDGGEIDGVLQRGGPPPRILSIIHTAGDTVDKVRPDEVEKAVPVVERTIRLFDAAAK